MRNWLWDPFYEILPDRKFMTTSVLYLAVFCLLFITDISIFPEAKEGSLDRLRFSYKWTA